MKNSEEIPAVPEKKKGNVLSDKVKLKDLYIFESDEFIRMFPGEKRLSVYKNKW